jgi:hypothetical protein
MCAILAVSTTMPVLWRYGGDLGAGDMRDAIPPGIGQAALRRGGGGAGALAGPRLTVTVGAAGRGAAGRARKAGPRLTVTVGERLPGAGSAGPRARPAAPPSGASVRWGLKRACCY